MRHSTSHPLHSAHSATVASNGSQVYVVCGWEGCQTRRTVTRAEWALEEIRRQKEGQPVRYVAAAVRVE